MTILGHFSLCYSSLWAVMIECYIKGYDQSYYPRIVVRVPRLPKCRLQLGRTRSRIRCNQNFGIWFPLFSAWNSLLADCVVVQFSRACFPELVPPRQPNLLKPNTASRAPSPISIVCRSLSNLHCLPGSASRPLRTKARERNISLQIFMTNTIRFTLP